LADLPNMPLRLVALRMTATNPQRPGATCTDSARSPRAQPQGVADRSREGDLAFAGKGGSGQGWLLDSLPWWKANLRLSRLPCDVLSCVWTG
jgi:hypothetical protein